MRMKLNFVTGLFAAGLTLINGLALAAGQYGPGASDAEIKIGNTMPYSGPASAYGIVGKTQGAYFDMINAQGGINGRKLNFISRDDGYSPPKTVEQVRQLVEQDQVLLMFSPLGTPPNVAIHAYLNDNKVPQLFVATGANQWNDPKHFPWTMGWLPSYGTEGHIYAAYILKNLPNAKIAVLYQNAILIAAIPKFAAQAIRKIYDIGWKPTTFLTSVSNSVGTVMKNAGPEKGVGIISAAFAKDPTDPQWQNSHEYKDWLAFMQKYNSGASTTDIQAVIGYSQAQLMAAVLKASGNDLTRDNVMKQAASVHDLKLPMLLPGITVSTGPDDFAPLKQMQLQKFDGTGWKLFGDVISASGS